MCGIIAGCPSRPESTRCACGISLGLVRARRAQCGARHAPRRGPEGGVRARRRAGSLEAPVRGALCPARGRHARTPTDAPNRGAPDQPPGRAGGAARRAAPNASFDLIRRGPRCGPRELCKTATAFCAIRQGEPGRARPAAAYIVGRLSPVQPRRGGANGQGRARRQKKTAPYGAALFRDARTWRIRYGACGAAPSGGLRGPLQRPEQSRPVTGPLGRLRRPGAAVWLQRQMV